MNIPDWRLVYNLDCSEAFMRHPPPVTAEQFVMPLDEVADGQVDAFVWSPLSGDMVAFYRSEVAEIYGAGRPPDTDRFTLSLDAFFRAGLDPLEIMLRRARAHGMAFLAGVRMNDSHHKSDPLGPMASAFWKANPQFRLWEVADGGAYYNANLDYTYPEVRQRRLDVIRELAQRYDVDGLEIDFGRNPQLFNPSEAWAKRDIATDFMRQVRRLLDDLAQRKGRPLVLLVRVPFYPSGDRHIRHEAHRHGIDLETWMRQRLADLFALSPLRGNDLGLDLDPWKRIAAQAGVRLLAGVEANLVHNAPAHNYSLNMDPDEFRAVAQNWLHQQPDGLYVFNYPCVLTPALGRPALYRDYLLALRQMRSLETLRGVDKTFSFYKDLPLELEVGRPARCHQTVPFTVREPDIARLAGRFQIRFKVTGFPDPAALDVLVNDSLVPSDRVRWERAWDGLAAGGIAVAPGRSGHSLGPHYAVVTVHLPPEAIRCGPNTIGFFLKDGPRTEHTFIFIHELEVRSVFPR